jgi:hypothetical protein
LHNAGCENFGLNIRSTGTRCSATNQCCRQFSMVASLVRHLCVFAPETDARAQISCMEHARSDINKKGVRLLVETEVDV